MNDMVTILSMIINILLIAFFAYLVFSIFMIVKRNKKNKQYIMCIDNIDNQDDFFETIDNFIFTLKDQEFITKAQIIKLYGAVYHNQESLYQSTLDKIDIAHLMFKGDKYNAKMAQLNEDSFYYLSFLIPMYLNYNHQNSYLGDVENKLVKYQSQLANCLFYQIYQASSDIYENTQQHVEFFTNFLDGDYSASYAKQMIGLYKKTAAMMLAAIYIKNNEYDKLVICNDLVLEFIKSKLGTQEAKLLQIDEYYNSIKTDVEIDKNIDDNSASEVIDVEAVETPDVELAKSAQDEKDQTHS